MKHTIALLLAGTLVSYGQETNRETVSLETGLGLTTVMTANHGTLFGQNMFAGLKKTVFQKDNLTFRTGLAYNGSTFENHLKTNTVNHFISVPVSVRISADTKENTIAPFLEFGLYGKSLVASQTQYIKKQSFDGFSTGMRVEVGTMLTQSAKYSVGVKLSYESDFYSTIKHAGETYKFNNASIGLEFRLK
ncbi:hypothetical protein AB4865_03170 [Capnocytophaga sp. ARDL2]|uniref:hypothetical protein n=1 Tax=Capnocytophaga sp. ARDL2 TaxID=3238809 RepID=UPI0035571C05